MLFYALDQNGPILPKNAKRGEDYSCPSCRKPVRLRSGIVRRAHFFHIREKSDCSFQNKGITHSLIQLHFYHILPQSDVILEADFPKIQRIADVYWVSKKIVFEIQCSPISLKEVKQRIADYKKEGCEVVWILDSRRFNKHRLSASENYLRKTTFFYADFSRRSRGMIYDQFDFCHLGERIFTSRRYPINPRFVFPIRSNPAITLPSILQVKSENAPFCFQGDLLYKSFFQDQAATFKKFLDIETRAKIGRFPKTRLSLKFPLKKWLHTGLKTFINSFLIQTLPSALQQKTLRQKNRRKRRERGRHGSHF